MTISNKKQMTREAFMNPANGARPARPTRRWNGGQKTRDEIEAIRAKNPIEQVIGQHVELQPRGRLLVARCPFHDDLNPSLTVYAHTQTWHCFGCDAGGDVFAFVERIERIRFGEALRRLDTGTINSPPRSQPVTRTATAGLAVFPKPSEPIQLTSEHFMLLTAAAEIYHAAIFKQPQALAYLAKRRIDLDTIRRHRIGYVTGNDLAPSLRHRGWDPQIAQDLGLLGTNGEPPREFFRQRIVIPEIRSNQVVYLVGRATQKYQKAKYLTLPGAPKPRYGLEAIRGAREVFLVEGPFDWLTLLHWGYPTLALMGSHVKDELIDELHGAVRIYVVTHPDEAGLRVASQLAEMFAKRTFILPPLPNAKDPNELAQQPHGRETFAALVLNAI
jgi:DNA primase